MIRAHLADSAKLSSKMLLAQLMVILSDNTVVTVPGLPYIFIFT